MNFEEVIKLRYSVRNFKKEKIEKEKVEMILNAGMLAPTACNNQPQRILVLDSANAIEKLKSCTPYTFNAPLILIVCFDENISWKRPSDGVDMGEVDASIVTTQMMLEVTNLELGSTWVGNFDVKKLKILFSLPESFHPIAILPIGYPTESSIPHPNHSKRDQIEEKIFLNSL